MTYRNRISVWVCVPISQYDNNSRDIILNGKTTHLEDFKVVHQGSPESFSSKLVAERAFAKGSLIARLEGHTSGPKRYSSVQISETEHIELNSDIVFMNHSCNPSTLMDVDHMVVSAATELAAGDELTFFYPSTEWDMAQPFSCWCGSSKCIGTVQGAQYLSSKSLSEFQLSHHIKDLIKARDASCCP